VRWAASLPAAVTAAFLAPACSDAEPQEARWTDYVSAVATAVRAEISRPGGECERADLHAVWTEAAERMGEKDLLARSGVSAEEWRQLDVENRAELTSLLEDYGWPQPCMLSRPAATGLFYVVQHHTDPQIRRDGLPVLEAMARQGRVRSSEVAMLVDRVLTDQDMPQRYGTQYACDQQAGRYRRIETEAPEGLAQRRRDMGLIAHDVELRLINARNSEDRRCRAR
jgi:hypothetical protein